MNFLRTLRDISNYFSGFGNNYYDRLEENFYRSFDIIMSGTLKTTPFKVWSFLSTRKCTAFSVQKILLNEFSCIQKISPLKEKSPIKPLPLGRGRRFFGKFF